MLPRPGSAASTAAMSPLLLLLLLALALFAGSGHSCNEAICASVVSKCMLTQSCKCDLITCTCCKECFSCLSYLYDECCSCVDLCPKPNVTDNELSRKSHVQNFNVSMPGLFDALTAEPDPHKRWRTYNYPVDIDISVFSPKLDKELKYRLISEDTMKSGENLGPDQHPLKPNVLTMNCTVAYLSRCNSWNKCQQACQSMGASSYRWFHDGCCECIGETCINYGINESRCPFCPVDKEGRVPGNNRKSSEQYDDYGQDDDDAVASDEFD